MTSLLSLKHEVALLTSLLPKPQVQHIVEVVGPDGHVYDRWIIPTGKAPLATKYTQYEDTEL